MCDNNKLRNKNIIAWFTEQAFNDEWSSHGLVHKIKHDQVKIEGEKIAKTFIKECLGTKEFKHSDIFEYSKTM